MQHDRTAAYVIAQQYYSATFISRHFHCRKERSGALFENVKLFRV
jgi:hypothetical protein